MVNHFSTIGFTIETAEDLERLAIEGAESGREIEARDGNYILWEVGNGIELWVQGNRQFEVFGVNPHYSGSAVMRVALTESFRRPEDTVLDGAFYGWADPNDEGSSNGAYPLVFDSPDFQLYRSFSYPVTVEAQIAAFAHNIEVFDSEEEFYRGQTDPPVSAESFFPIGLFADDQPGEQQEERVTPAQALFSGTIMETSLQRNSFSGGEFFHMRVRTFGGEVDVVADVALVEQEPCVGNIVQGEFWLSGRLRNYPGRRERQLLQDIFRN